MPHSTGGGSVVTAMTVSYGK